MNTKSFSEVANKVMARIERVARYEGVVTEILSRVLGDEDIPTPCIEVDTDENVNLVYELKEAPKTSRITILAAVFPSMTNKGGNKLKIYYSARRTTTSSTGNRIRPSKPTHSRSSMISRPSNNRKP